MRVEHLKDVQRIERVAFPTPWAMEAYRHELETNRFAAYYVARVQARRDAERDAGAARRGVLVGYAGLWSQADSAHISTIAVHPRWRRRHIAEALLTRLIDHALRQGLRFVTLEVRESNLAAQKLYSKFGFVQVGRRQAYYPDNKEDALILSTPPVDEPSWREAYEKRRSLGALTDPSTAASRR